MSVLFAGLPYISPIVAQSKPETAVKSHKKVKALLYWLPYCARGVTPRPARRAEHVGARCGHSAEISTLPNEVGKFTPESKG